LRWFVALVDVEGNAPLVPFYATLAVASRF